MKGALAPWGTKTSEKFCIEIFQIQDLTEKPLVATGLERGRAAAETGKEVYIAEIDGLFGLRGTGSMKLSTQFELFFS